MVVRGSLCESLARLPEGAQGCFTFGIDSRLAPERELWLGVGSRPGLKIAFQKQDLLAQFPDAFTPFLAFGCTLRTHYQGTLFRFPLRCLPPCIPSMSLSSLSYLCWLSCWFCSAFSCLGVRQIMPIMPIVMPVIYLRLGRRCNTPPPPTHRPPACAHMRHGLPALIDRFTSRSFPNI